MSYQAEKWKSKVNLLEYVKCKIPIEEKELGATVFDVYPEGITTCHICGNRLWHYWIAETCDNSKIHIGHGCASVILGCSPAQYIKSEKERKEYESELERLEASKVESLRWFHHPNQAELRKTVILGARQERKLFYRSNFFTYALKVCKANRLSEKFRNWIMKVADGDVVKTATLQAATLDSLKHLQTCRLGRYDVDFINVIRGHHESNNLCSFQSTQKPG